MANEKIILENKSFALTLGADCVAESLICKANGEECLMPGKRISLFSVTQPRPFNNEVKLAHPNKRTTFQANRVRKEGDSLIVGFEITPFEAEIAVTVTDAYMVFTLKDFIIHPLDYDWLNMTPPPVSEFRLIQLPVKNRERFGEWLNVSWDDNTTVNVLANNPYPRIDSERRDGYRLMTADALKGVKLKGCQAALIVSQTDKFLDAMDCLEEDYHLPHGARSRRSESINVSAYWGGNINPTNVDAHIAFAKKGGFRHMLMYSSCFVKYDNGYLLYGNYDLRDEYPNGIEDVKKMLDKIKAAGITPGIHILQTHIGTMSRYVTPEVDPRLNITDYFTLAKDVSETDDVVEVLQNPEFAEMHPNRRVLNFDGEAIYYESYTTEPPYRFLGCKRGHYRTNVKPHKAGTIGGILDVSEYGGTSIYIDQKTDLQDEIAKKLAAIYNAGCEFIYFDGSEGANPDPYEIYIPLAQYRVLKQLNKETLFAEGAAKAHFSWHFMSGGNAFDVFPTAVFKQKIDEFPAEEAPRMRNDFTRLNFGWWGYFLDTEPDIYEYGTSRAAAYDCPITMQSNSNFFVSNQRTDDNLEVLRRWEEARRTHFLTDEMKKELQKAGVEHILLINEEKKFELVTYERLSVKDGVPVTAYTFERKGKTYLVLWHKTADGKLLLPLSLEDACYETELGEKDLTVAKQDGGSVLEIAGRRYLSGSFTKEDLEKALANAQIIE
ncbi:MAG: hypothetical protein J6K61_07215 [Clostridia bacterium]|nr:hypothetical protein [Clostridia bacterium]